MKVKSDEKRQTDDSRQKIICNICRRYEPKIIFFIGKEKYWSLWQVIKSSKMYYLLGKIPFAFTNKKIIITINIINMNTEIGDDKKKTT